MTKRERAENFAVEEYHHNTEVSQRQENWMDKKVQGYGQRCFVAGFDAAIDAVLSIYPVVVMEGEELRGLKETYHKIRQLKEKE